MRRLLWTRIEEEWEKAHRLSKCSCDVRYTICGCPLYFGPGFLYTDKSQSKAHRARELAIKAAEKCSGRDARAAAKHDPIWSAYAAYLTFFNLLRGTPFSELEDPYKCPELRLGPHLRLVRSA